MNKHAWLIAALFSALAPGLRAEDSLQKQVDDLKEEIRYIKNNYERTEPVEVVKQVTEWVSPSGEVFREPQKDGVSPTDGSKLEERSTYRMMKFSRREAVGDKIDAAVSSAINGHVIVGVEMLGVYQNVVGAGDVVDGTGVTRSANRGTAMGGLDISLTGKPMRNTLLFVDLDAASGMPGLSEAWVQVNDPKKVVSLQAGVLDLTGAFDGNSMANDETTQFMTPEFVNSPLLMNPANSLGAVLRLNLANRYEVSAGAQNNLGSRVDPSGDLYWVGELGLRYHLLGDIHARVWGRQLPRGSQQPDQALGASVDDRLSSRVTVFGRCAKSSYVEAFEAAHVDADPAVGYVPDTPRVALNLLDWAASGGVEFTNFNPRNLKAKVGLAYGRTAHQDLSSDDFVELYNRIPLTPNFALGLHYQSISSRVQSGLRDPVTGELFGLDALPNTHRVSLRVLATY